MDNQTLVYLILGAGALLVLYRAGYLDRLKPRAPGSPPPAPAPAPAPAAPPALGPGYVLVREQQPPPVSDGPVHETSITMPVTIRVIPQPPRENHG